MGILDRFFSAKHRSTKHVTVFAMKESESQLEKAILLACAKRESNVHNFLANASEQDKNAFWDALAQLIEAIGFHATVSDKLLLFLDNNVLEDISHAAKAENQKRINRFYALLAFLLLVEDYYCLDIFACISPAILYEASHRGQKPLREAIDNTVQQLAQVGLKTHFIGFKSENELKLIFRLVKRDETRLLKALNIIKNKKWERDFKSLHGNGISIPFGVAEYECPEVKLDYFSPHVVKFLLMHNIENRMFDENKENPTARKYMNNPRERAFSIISPRKNGVEGLGDIELLTYCNLHEQTSRGAIDITAGITFDKGLIGALRKMTTTSDNMTIVGGVDDPDDSTTRLTYYWKRNQRRTEKAERRSKELDSQLEKFADEVLKRHFIGRKEQSNSQRGNGCQPT